VLSQNIHFGIRHSSLPAATRACNGYVRVNWVSANDEALMLAYQKGETLAFNELYTRYRGPLYRFLSRTVKDVVIGEDLYQECWNRVIDARERYQPSAAFKTYLFQIARNLALDYLRRQRPTVSLDQNDDEDRVVQFPASDEATMDERMIEAETHQQLLALIAQLPDEQRVLVLLKAEGELSLEEMATMAGTGRETIKSRLRYALAKLRAGIKR
jgi:RNA polymerase sigma-70 factor, ECF subfamily